MSLLKESLKKKGISLMAAPPEPSEPLWKGPEIDGITQSMLGSWLICRERFRLRYIEGWQETDQWNHRTGYGDMWHVCEEALAAGQNPANKVDQWTPLNNFARELCKRYPMQQLEIVKWYEICRRQFPEYVRYWASHPDIVDRTPLFQEQVFDVAYALPSGRTVRLRGKWDSVDLVGKGRTAGIFLMENKTKGEIDEQQMKRQLSFDLQTMLYLVSLQETKKQLPKLWSRFLDHPIVGVRYNVIRRPFSGGKGSIVQHQASHGAKCPSCKGLGKKKANRFSDTLIRCPKCNGQCRIGGKPEETLEHYYDRLVTDYIAKEPEYWFMRWTVHITQPDIDRFKREFLDPCLEQLCDWYTWIAAARSNPYSPDDGCEAECVNEGGPYDRPVQSSIHYRLPFGIYSPLIDGGATALDEMLSSGSQVGLRRADKLFKELT